MTVQSKPPGDEHTSHDTDGSEKTQSRVSVVGEIPGIWITAARSSSAVSGPQSRASATPVSGSAGQRFPFGELEYPAGGDTELVSVELAAFLARHAAGDWGESAYAEDNEAALRDGRAVLSVFRSGKDARFWIITWGRRDRTTIWPQQCADEIASAPSRRGFICTYVASGRRAEVQAVEGHILYPVPLFARRGPGGTEEEERAYRILASVVAAVPTTQAFFRAEQFVRALWQGVAGMDFRPIDDQGQRVSEDPSNPSKPSSGRAWQRAYERCRNEPQICAWFAVKWEDRL